MIVTLIWGEVEIILSRWVDMGKMVSLNGVIETHGIKFVEQALVLHYLRENDVNISGSQIVEAFMRGFEPVPLSTLSKLDFSHGNLKALESNLELLIPMDDRKLNGAFFTPSYVVDFIIQQVNPTEDTRNLDPSCGSGAFLLGLVDYYHKRLGKSIRQAVKENIYGADILPYNIERAKLLLSLYGLQYGEHLLPEDFNLFCGDSLSMQWDLHFDNIVGNPPYVKFQDLPESSRVSLSRDWETVEGGAYNLYFAFFELGYRLLRENGKLGFITPNNYFTSLSGESLRKYFSRNKAVSRIVDFSHIKVFDAQTYTAITFLSKVPSEAILYDRIKDGETPASFLSHANGSPNLVNNLDSKKWRLLKSDEQRNIRQIETVGVPLGKLFDICVGVATLRDAVYFVDGRLVDGEYYVKENAHGRFLIEKAVTRAVYKISDFKSQADVDGNSRRIICPYRIEGHGARVIPEPEFKTDFPSCYAYLLSEKEALLARDKGKVKMQPFYMWGRSQGLSKRGRRILSPTFSLRPRFLGINEQDAFFTNGYGIFFKENIPQSLLESPHELSHAENADVLRKVLNSELMHYYVTRTSVSIEGGYPCYQKNFIEKFTIPQFSNKEVHALRLLANDAEIHQFLCEKYQVSLPEPNLLS